MQEGAYDALIPQLLKAYKQVRAGDPLVEGTLLGPLHTKDSKTRFLDGIKKIKEQVRLCSIFVGSQHILSYSVGS